MVASIVVGGHQPPGGSSEWSRLIKYNNQILEGATGGVMAWRLSSSGGRVDDASRLTNVFPIDGLTTKAPPSIAASVTLHLQNMRSGVGVVVGGSLGRRQECDNLAFV